MKKGLTLSLALLLTASATLAACSKGSTSKEQSPAPAKPAESANAQSTIPADKKFDITVMSWQEAKAKYGQAYNYGFNEYMKLHPNVKIEYVYQPQSGGGYDKLLDTQFVAHKAPDAIQLNSGWITKYLEQGYLMQLDGYMHAPTPYSEGKNWVDTFVNGENAMTTLKSRNKFGSIAYVPVDGGPGGAALLPIYYNKDMLDKAGVTNPPATWEEFIAACKKLKDAGMTPVAADNNRFLNWIYSFIGQQMGDGYLPAMFDEKYKKRELYQDQAMVALLTGKVGKSDAVLSDEFDIVKDFSQYWQNGWAGTGEQEASQLFLYGKTAFIVDGNWQYGYYEENIKNFKFGVMPFPLITKSTSKYAAEGYPVGGDQVTSGFGLNKDLEKDPDKLKVVLDLFQFMTSKAIQTKISEIGITTPVTAGITPPDKMKVFMADEKSKLLYAFNNPMYNLAKDAVPISQEFLTGKTDKGAYLDKLEQNNLATITQKVKDSLDAKIGLPSQIANLEKQLADQKAAGQPDVVIKATQNSLDLAKLKLEFYQKYAEPALKK